jgi:hypothetical protein
MWTIDVILSMHCNKDASSGKYCYELYKPIELLNDKEACSSCGQAYWKSVQDFGNDVKEYKDLVVDTKLGKRMEECEKEKVTKSDSSLTASLSSHVVFVCFLLKFLF